MDQGSSEWTGRYRSGVEAYRQGRYAEAISTLSPMIGGDELPERIARYYCGMSHRALGLDAMNRADYDEAESRLRQAVRTIGASCDLSEYLATLYARTGRYHCCSEQMDVAAEQGRSAQIRRQAMAQWQAGRRAEAYMTLTAALRQGDDASLNLQLGIFHAAEEHYDAAKDALTKAARADSGEAEPWRYLGLVAAAIGRPADAVRHLQRSLELRPADVMTAYQLSLAARAAGEAGHAVTLRLPDLVSVGRSSRSASLDEYITGEPDFVDACLALPSGSVDEEVFGVLAEALHRALQRHPSYADLHLYHGLVLKRIGRVDQAEAAIRRALAINPRYLRAMLDLGRLLEGTGRSEEAASTLDSAVVCGADWPDVHCLLGELLARCGKADGARKHLGRALELKSDYPHARETLELLAYPGGQV